jgi:hypothetical protein
MARVIYLTNYKRNGVTYPIGGGGNFPVTVGLGPCAQDNTQLKFEEKLKVLKEEISVAAKRTFQNIISLKDSSQLMSLSSVNVPSTPLLYYNE